MVIDYFFSKLSERGLFSYFNLKLAFGITCRPASVRQFLFHHSVPCDSPLLLCVNGFDVKSKTKEFGVILNFRQFLLTLFWKYWCQIFEISHIESPWYLVTLVLIECHSCWRINAYLPLVYFCFFLVVAVLFISWQINRKKYINRLSLMRYPRYSVL